MFSSPHRSRRLRRRAGHANSSGYRGSGSTHGRANATPDTGTGHQPHVSLNPHGYHDGRPNQPSGPPAVTHAHNNLYSDANADSGTHSHSHSETHCDSGTNTHCHTHAYLDAVAYPGADACANQHPRTDRYAHARADP